MGEMTSNYESQLKSAANRVASNNLSLWILLLLTFDLKFYSCTEGKKTLFPEGLESASWFITAYLRFLWDDGPEITQDLFISLWEKRPDDELSLFVQGGICFMWFNW